MSAKLTRSCNEEDEVGLERGDVPSQAGLMPDGCLMSFMKNSQNVQSCITELPTDRTCIEIITEC